MTRFKKSISLSIIIAVFAFISISLADTQKKITILHTNDIHGHFTPDEAIWLDNNPPIGGFAAIDHYVRLQRADAGRSLLLDAGDVMTGNLISKKKYKGAYGGALIEMMNIIGYDCMVIGNHEFDSQGDDISPITNIKILEKIADFPILCANMIDSSGNHFSDKHYKIFEINDLKVGIIGVTYHQMRGMVSPDDLGGFYSTDPAAKINDIVTEIDDPTDLIIVLSHLGYGKDIELAKKIKYVDVIIGGHTHTRLEQPEKVNGVLVLQAGSYSHNLGRLDLTVSDDSVVSYSGRLISTLVKDNTKAQPQLQKLIDRFAKEINKEFAVVIGHLKYDWRCTYQSESSVGNDLTDMPRNITGADIALLNSGGIRKDISAGPITKKDINELLPFQNYVETFELTGEEIKNIVKENARAQGFGTHGILQLSGLTYKWKLDGKSVLVSDIIINGKPLQSDQVYKIASVDYINANYETYYGVKPRSIYNTGRIISDVIIEAILEIRTLQHPPLLNRVKRLN